METKPGYKTTEFWTAIVIQLVNFSNLVGIWDFMSNTQSAKVMGFVGALYAIGRGVAKAGVKPNLPS